MSGFSDKTVLITGASRGIGLATARRFAQLGARVGMVARQPQTLEAAAASVPGTTHAVAADLSDPAACQTAVAEIEQALGPVDVLVSNAGLLYRDFVEDVTVDDFEASYRVNVGAPLWLAQAVLPQMRGRGTGSIVLVASELGIIGAPSYASYCTSKAAMVALGEVLCHELKGSGVNVATLCPGDIQTDQLADEQKWGPTGGETYDKAMKPEYVARQIVRAAGHTRLITIVDRPHLRLAFHIMAGPRRLRFGAIHSAFAPTLRDREAKATQTGG